MSERRVTRAELLQALSFIGVFARDGQGVEAVHRFSTASLVAIDMFGYYYKMNGESNDGYDCLIVQVKNTPIHDMRPGDLWEDPPPSYDAQRVTGYFSVVSLHGPTVVRGWWICGTDSPKLVEVTGDLFQQHAKRTDPKTQLTTPGPRPGPAVEKP